MRKVVLAENAGFCFGVQRAVEESLKIQKKYNREIYTLGPLIHNSDVVKFLEDNKIFAIEGADIDKLAKNDVIVIRSHGVSKAVIDLLESKELTIINATCPFVTKIQNKVDKYSKEGYKIAILGDENHPEVVGINGWCNNQAIITRNGEFNMPIPRKVCVVAQTTEKKENWNRTIQNLSSDAKELLAFNTICAATEVRQKSVLELSSKSDLMIVVGGKNSSNTTKLYEIAKKNCENTIHIENSSELTDDIVSNEEFKLVGITAGASTPDWIINEVIGIMEGKVKWKIKQD